MPDLADTLVSHRASFPPSTCPSKERIIAWSTKLFNWEYGTGTFKISVTGNLARQPDWGKPRSWLYCQPCWCPRRQRGPWPSAAWDWHGILNYLVSQLVYWRTSYLANSVEETFEQFWSRWGGIYIWVSIWAARSNAVTSGLVKRGHFLHSRNSHLL